MSAESVKSIQGVTLKMMGRFHSKRYLAYTFIHLHAMLPIGKKTIADLSCISPEELKMQFYWWTPDDTFVVAGSFTN